MVLSSIISESEILAENHDFFHTPALDPPPVKAVLRRNIAIVFGTKKLEWCGPTKVDKVFYLLYLARR